MNECPSFSHIQQRNYGGKLNYDGPAVHSTNYFAHLVQDLDEIDLDPDYNVIVPPLDCKRRHLDTWEPSTCLQNDTKNLFLKVRYIRYPHQSRTFYARDVSLGVLPRNGRSLDSQTDLVIGAVVIVKLDSPFSGYFPAFIVNIDHEVFLVFFPFNETALHVKFEDIVALVSRSPLHEIQYIFKHNERFARFLTKFFHNEFHPGNFDCHRWSMGKQFEWNIGWPEKSEWMTVKVIAIRPPFIEVQLVDDGSENGKKYKAKFKNQSFVIYPGWYRGKEIWKTLSKENDQNYPNNSRPLKRKYIEMDPKLVTWNIRPVPPLVIHGMTRQITLFKDHICSPVCGERGSVFFLSNFGRDFSLRGFSCFLWPLFFGFSRFKISDIPSKIRLIWPQAVQDNFDKYQICYIAPCGVILFDESQVASYLDATSFSLQIAIDSFSFRSDLQMLPSKELKDLKCYVCSDDISNGREMRQTVSMVNEVDYMDLPYNFKYKFKPTFPTRTDYSFRSNCDCEDNCVGKNCPCKQLTLESNFGSSRSKDSEKILYKDKKLFSLAQQGIYECHEGCKCNSRCPNRVVGEGTKFLLQLFHTKNKGFGIRALQDIPRGAFLGIYSGVYVDLEARSNFNACYVFKLDFVQRSVAHKSGYEEYVVDPVMSGQSIWQSECVRQRIIPGRQIDPSRPSPLFTPFEDLEPRCGFRSSISMFEINADTVGSFTRFFNHSCSSPNIESQIVFTDTHDPRLPLVAFFAKKKIPALTEICWQYQWDFSPRNKRVAPCMCRKGCTNTTIRSDINQEPARMIFNSETDAETDGETTQMDLSL